MSKNGDQAEDKKVTKQSIEVIDDLDQFLGASPAVKTGGGSAFPASVSAFTTGGANTTRGGERITPSSSELSPTTRLLERHNTNHAHQQYRSGYGEDPKTMGDILLNPQLRALDIEIYSPGFTGRSVGKGKTPNSEASGGTPKETQAKMADDPNQNNSSPSTAPGSSPSSAAKKEKSVLADSLLHVQYNCELDIIGAANNLRPKSQSATGPSSAHVDRGDDADSDQLDATMNSPTAGAAAQQLGANPDLGGSHDVAGRLNKKEVKEVDGLNFRGSDGYIMQAIPWSRITYVSKIFSVLDETKAAIAERSAHPPSLVTPPAAAVPTEQQGDELSDGLATTTVDQDLPGCWPWDQTPITLSDTLVQDSVMQSTQARAQQLRLGAGWGQYGQGVGGPGTVHRIAASDSCIFIKFFAVVLEGLSTDAGVDGTGQGKVDDGTSVHLEHKDLIIRCHNGPDARDAVYNYIMTHLAARYVDNPFSNPPSSMQRQDSTSAAHLFPVVKIDSLTKKLEGKVRQALSDRAYDLEVQRIEATLLPPTNGESFPRQPQGLMDKVYNFARHLVSKKKRRFEEEGFDLDLSYITTNIVALGYPSSGTEAKFRNPMEECVRFLESRHSDRKEIHSVGAIISDCAGQSMGAGGEIGAGMEAEAAAIRVDKGKGKTLASKGTSNEGRYTRLFIPMEDSHLYRSRRSRHYRVVNLCSERQYETLKFGGRFERFPFDDHEAPPLELVVRFCEAMGSFLLGRKLNSNDSVVDRRSEASQLRDFGPRTIAIHCKAGKGRTGTMIVALLLHLRICNTLTEALDLYAKKRSKKEHGITQASQLRFMRYYERVLLELQGTLPKIRPCALQTLILKAPPCIDMVGGCTPYVIVQRRRPGNRHKVFGHSELSCSGALEVIFDGSESEKVGVQLKHYIGLQCGSISLPLRGTTVQDEFRVSVWSKKTSGLLQPKDELICSFWLHSSFLNGDTGTWIGKQEELEGATGSRKELFGTDFTVTLHFSVYSPLERPPGTPMAYNRHRRRPSATTSPGSVSPRAFASPANRPVSPAASGPGSFSLSSAVAPAYVPPPAYSDPTKAPQESHTGPTTQGVKSSPDRMMVDDFEDIFAEGAEPTVSSPHLGGTRRVQSKSQIEATDEIAADDVLDSNSNSKAHLSSKVSNDDGQDDDDPFAIPALSTGGGSRSSSSKVSTMSPGASFSPATTSIRPAESSNASSRTATPTSAIPSSGFGTKVLGSADMPPNHHQTTTGITAPPPSTTGTGSGGGLTASKLRRKNQQQGSNSGMTINPEDQDGMSNQASNSSSSRIGVPVQNTSFTTFGGAFTGSDFGGGGSLTNSGSTTPAAHLTPPPQSLSSSNHQSGHHQHYHQPLVPSILKGPSGSIGSSTRTSTGAGSPKVPGSPRAAGLLGRRASFKENLIED